MEVQSVTNPITKRNLLLSSELRSSENIRKYFHYIFNRKSFQPRFDFEQPAAAMREMACQLRGPEQGPAIMIHGILPRAGTVYVGQVLRLHPDLCAFPRDLYELPFLQLSEDINRLQEKFLLYHRHNRGKLGDSDFLALFGSTIIAFLHHEVPANQRMLVKVPSVEYLHFFPVMYPHEHLLLLTRDGRDVVESTVRTWPQIHFWLACLRWRRAAEMVVGCHDVYRERQQGYWLARYEDAVTDPVAFVQEACRRFNLDESRYPFEQIETIRVRGSSQLQKEGGVHWQPVDKPAAFQPTQYWREWSSYKKWLFKRIAGQALIDLGYSEDMNW